MCVCVLCKSCFFTWLFSLFHWYWLLCAQTFYLYSVVIMYTYHDIVCMVHPITLLILKDFEILLGIPELGTWLACAVYVILC